LLALYLGHCRHELQLTPHSLRQQFFNLRYVQRWFAEHYPCFPAATTTPHIEDFLAFQRDIRGNSLAHLHHYLYTLRRFFRLLVDEGLLSEDPTQPLHLKKPKVRNIRHILSLAELNRLLHAAREDRDRGPTQFHLLRIQDVALIGLLATTGCRLFEALALRRCHIGPDTRVVFYPGKGDLRHAVRERVVPLEDPQVRNDLDLWLQHRPSEPETMVFVTSAGQPLDAKHVHRRLRRLVRLAQLDRKVTAHSLRATFASRLVENGIDPLTLQQLMGHTNLKTTLTLYVKLDVNTLQDTWRRTNPLTALPKKDDDQTDL
jgi:site-specific recombinase XerD